MRVDNGADPKLANDDDILLRVMATAIRGSDMHIYRGKFAGMEKGELGRKELASNPRGSKVTARLHSTVNSCPMLHPL